jgi:glutamate 5-kinase
MSTKIVAARLATSAGVTTVITRSSTPGNIVKIARHVQASRSPPSLVTQTNNALTNGDDHSIDAISRSSSPFNPDCECKIPLHTRFLPSAHPIRDRSFWILHGLKPHGTVYIDTGAHKALVGKAGLLPVGVVDVDGTFAQHDAVRICVVEKRSCSNDNGKLWDGPAVEVARALTNYSYSEVARIKGHQSTEIEGLLGYADSEYVAQREYISFFRRDSRPQTPTREILDAHGISGYEAEASTLMA